MSAPFELRSAAKEDHARFVRLFAELGVDDPVPDAERWWREFGSTTLFLERSGESAGYAMFELTRGTGYVRHLAVDPAHRREGLGRALMLALAARFRAADCTEWRLNVKAENAAAIALYESLGLRTAYPTWVLRLPWTGLERLPSAEPSIGAREITPEADARVEQAFDLSSGLLATYRARGGNALVELFDTSLPASPALGVARFDPRIPGSFPFRVARPELARRLLEHLRPLAPSSVPWIQLAVEEDAALASALIAVGAETKVEILHMHGKLP